MLSAQKVTEAEESNEGNVHGLPQSAVQASGASEGSMERYSRPLSFAFSYFLFLTSHSLSYIYILYIASCVSVWPLLPQSRSSFQQRSLTRLSLVQLSSVWFSAGSQWNFSYVQLEGAQSHL